MDANDFFAEIAKTMTDRDLIRAVGKISPTDREHKFKAGIYIRELSRRDIRTAMMLYEIWKEEGGGRA